MKPGLKDGDKYIDASTLPESFDELKNVVKNYTVFGRVTPEQKQRLIKAYQANKSVVGMVGDGVKYVLALKDADCGIAMAAGSDAATVAISCCWQICSFEGNRQRRPYDYLQHRIRSDKDDLFITVECDFYLIGTFLSVCIHLTLISTVAIGIPSFILALEQTETVTQSGFLKHVFVISSRNIWSVNCSICC